MLKSNPKIIVIGAGASGIAAATNLHENGFHDIIILEAENRIGGRIHTIPFGENFVEAGAMWCHGIKDNIVHTLASKYDLLSSAKTKRHPFEFRKSDRITVDFETGKRLTDILFSITEKYREDLTEFKGSLGEFIVTKYNEVVSGESYNDIDRELKEEVMEFFHKFENSIEASENWFDVSAEGYLQYWDCEGDRLLNWKTNGFKTILDILLRKFQETKKPIPIDIKFGKFVEKINWGGPDVQITCHDGSVYICDHVIITVSLGVLKEQHLNMFNPDLPPTKILAIVGLQIGTVGKIFLEFEKPFWDCDWRGFSLLWTKENLMNRDSKLPEWVFDIFAFYVVDYQPNVLVAWISGPHVHQMETTSKTDVVTHLIYLLKKFLQIESIPYPVQVFKSDWFSNKNFRGSFSYRSMLTERLNVKAAHLADPVCNEDGVPKLLFAGEATHDHYYSKVHGAIATGWRESKRIVKFYTKNVVKSRL